MFISAVTVSCWTGALAQTADEEELSPIIIDYGQERDEVAEEVFEDLIYDEETGSYRLLESDEIEEAMDAAPGDGPEATSDTDVIGPPVQTADDAAELKRLFDLYRDALENKAFLEADTLAKRVVELSIRLNGLDSSDSARAITNLGIAQHHNQDYESAMLNFASAIGIIERIEDRLSSSLINPLQGLAATQAATGRPDLARQSYRRAVHVSHVNEGPHNRNQIQTLESIAELHVSMGDFKEAVGIQDNIYNLQARNIDPDSMEIIPALRKKASWQHRLQLYQNERSTWRKVVQIIEEHKGKESLELITPLTNLGKSYLFVSTALYEYQPDVSASSGETYLRRARRIAERNPASDWLTVEDTMLALGDYYILSGRPNRASKVYEETWTMLSEENDARKLQTRRQHLERVNTLQKVLPPKYYNSEQREEGRPPPENFETGTITYSFDVLPTGRISNLAVIEARPKELFEFGRVAGRSLRRMIYRPRVDDGALVATPGVVYTHDFFYRPSDLPSMQPTPSSPPVTEDDADESAPSDDEA
jgi:tetratricopeptide (TPR) repeat protein